MTELNVDLLIEVAAEIRLHPDNFSMGTWWEAYERAYSAPDMTGSPHACGTVACVAGHAVALSGKRYYMAPDWMRQDSGGADLVDGDANPVDINLEARKALGLTQQQAKVMFLDWLHRHPWPWREPAAVADRLERIAKGDLVWDDDAEEWL